MKIAIVKLSALGDIIHALVVLQFIKKYNQKIEVDWIVEKSYRELLEFHPDINKVHVVKIKNSSKNQNYSFSVLVLTRISSSELIVTLTIIGLQQTSQSSTYS